MPQLYELTISKSALIDSVATNSDVEFNWSMQSVDIECEEDSKELLRHIIQLWLTIRGFSLAKTWTEKYKHAAHTTTRKSAGLQKELKKSDFPREG